jgi:hypothetical protein
MEEKRTARGRPRLGSPNPNKAVKFSTSLPPDIFARLVKYCEDEERDKSYAIKKALDPWLSERGY